MAETQRHKILVVEDESDVAKYLTTLLENAGYDVTVAWNGQEGMEVARRDRPNLVSLDISMPEMSGIKFYREIRDDADLGKIPIVIVTGLESPWAGPDGSGSFERFISTRKQVPPPDGFFEKPIDTDAYLKKIADLLRRT